MATKKNFQILQGETWQRVIRWEQLPFLYKPITAITLAAPAAITATAHGFKTGWRAALVSVIGMSEINALNVPPRDSDYHQMTVVDPNTVTFNDINSAEYTPYVSGGYLMAYTPVDMSGYTASMEIKSRIGGPVLITLTTVNGGIAIDNTNHTITLLIAAAVTDILTWKTAVYDLDMISASNVVTPLYTGTLSVIAE
jgi:hypothetical protein